MSKFAAIADYENEIVRLMADRDEWKQCAELLDKRNDKLRAALEEIAQHATRIGHSTVGAHWIETRARRALGEK